MQIGVVIAMALSSAIGVLVTIRYLLGVDSKRKMFKIGLARSIIKVAVGLLTGFGMALLLNATQHLKSVGVELAIIGATFLLGLTLSLKLYQVMLREWFAIDKTLGRLFKVSVFEFSVGTALLAVIIFVSVKL